MIQFEVRTLITFFAIFIANGTSYALDFGYYDAVVGNGTAAQAAAIAASGNTPILLNDVSAADLAPLDVLYIDNPSNGGYGAEFLAGIADISAFVNGGGALFVNDRYVTDAATILPGGAGIAFTRSLTEDVNFSVGTTLNDGPGGTLDDNSLDNLGLSTHGYATRVSLPAGAQEHMSTDDPTELVNFQYPFGSGFVMYSAFPLDAHRGNPVVDQYEQNLIAAVQLAADPAPTGTASIPTLSKWGMFIMALLFAIIAMYFIGKSKNDSLHQV